MKKVVVWGCGDYGQYLYRVIREFYSRRYKVIGMGDMRFEELNKQLAEGNFPFHDSIMRESVRHIYGYHEIKRMADAGELDGIIIGVLNQHVYKKIEDSISVMGIELFDLRQNDRIFAEEIAARAYTDKSGLIKVYVINNAYIFSHEIWNGNYRFSYLFTETGRVIQETDRYLNLSNSPAGDIFLPYEIMDLCQVTLEKAMSLLQLGADINYGHFVFSCMGKICKMEEAGFDGVYLMYDSKFAREWMNIICDIYNITSDRIIWINRDVPEKCFRVKELHCMQNLVDAGALNARLLHDFAEKILEAMGVAADLGEYPSRVYLKRYGIRRLIDCEEMLKEYGFVTVQPEALSVKEQIMLLAHADVVVAEHGAAVTNCLFMKAGSYLIETFGAGFVDMFFIEMAKARRIRFRMLVAQKEYASYDFKEDYTIHPTLLEMTLEEILH